MKSKEGIPDEDIEEMLEGELLTLYQVVLSLTFKRTDANIILIPTSQYHTVRIICTFCRVQETGDSIW